MRLRLWPYFFRQAATNIVENRVVHFIGLGTMVVSLLIFGTFLLFFVNLNTWIQGWGQTLSLSVYLQDEIDEVTRNDVASFIRNLPAAEIKCFISKEKALKDLKDAMGPQAGLLEGLPRNPLPASFEVVFKEVSATEVDPAKMKEALEQIRGVEEVQYSEEWLKRVEGLMSIVRLFGFIIGGLLCIGVLFIVTNTIKLTIYSRRDEIEIMKLVGATNCFVKAPFLLEGMMQGILSGTLALFILYSGYLLLSTKKMALISLAMLDFVFLPFPYVFSLFLLSVALGLVGSLISIGRFFDV